VAGTIALSVSQRYRQFALLRAVGATPGQVRLAVMAEQVALGVAGGVAGWLPGCWLASLAAAGMVSHDLLPAGSAAWLSPWLLLIAVISGVTIGTLSGLLAARRPGGPRLPTRSASRRRSGGGRIRCGRCSAWPGSVAAACWP
jgi:putative ABC transport system permease protein